MPRAAVTRSAKSARQFQRDQSREEAANKILSEAATEGGAERIAQREREVAKRRKEAKASALVFAYRYGKIESGDPGSPIIPFKLWAEQAGLLKQLLCQKLVIILKARQLGITWLVLHYALWNMLFTPGFSVVAISRSEDEAKELVRRLKVILLHLPPWLTRQKQDAEPGWQGPTWECNVMLVTISHPGGPDSRFIAEQSSPDSGRSFTAMLVILDEWAAQEYAREIWQSVGPTANRKRSGQIIGLSTMKLNTLFEEKYVEALNGDSDFYPIFLSWTADPERDEDWYEATKREFPDTYKTEYPTTVAEAFAHGEKRFFAEWNPSIHTFSPEKKIPAHWWRFRSMDWGFNDPFCVLYGAVDTRGCIWIYRELYANGMTATEVANWILEVEEDAQEDVHMGPADTQVGDHVGTTGPTVEEEFMKAGIFWEKADKARASGLQQMHSRLLAQDEDENGNLIDKPMLRISLACENLILQISRATRDKYVPDVISKSSVKHGIDAARYMCMARPFIPKKPKQRIARYERYSEPRKKGSWMSW